MTTPSPPKKENELFKFVVAPLLVAGLGFLGKFSWDNYISPTPPPAPATFDFDLRLININKPIPDVTIYLNDSTKNEKTDSDGRVIFPKLPIAVHSVFFTYKGSARLYKITSLNEQDVTKEYNLAEELVAVADPNRTPGDTTSGNGNGKPTVTATLTQQQLAAITEKQSLDIKPNDTVSETRLLKNENVAIINTFEKSKVNERPVDPNGGQQSVDPNALLNSLKLTVYIDYDKKSTDGFTPFDCSLEGTAADLDKIKTVYYQRNHSTMPEHKKSSFFTSSQRSTNFRFTANQWGSITTAYVSIKLKDGRQSNVVIKEIEYKN